MDLTLIAITRSIYRSSTGLASIVGCGGSAASIGLFLLLLLLVSPRWFDIGLEDAVESRAALLPLCLPPEVDAARPPFLYRPPPESD